MAVNAACRNYAKRRQDEAAGGFSLRGLREEISVVIIRMKHSYMKYLDEKKSVNLNKDFLKTCFAFEVDIQQVF